MQDSVGEKEREAARRAWLVVKTQRQATSVQTLMARAEALIAHLRAREQARLAAEASPWPEPERHRL